VSIDLKLEKRTLVFKKKLIGFAILEKKPANGNVRMRMEIWLDTSNLAAVHKAFQLGILHGVTTNPSIAAHSGMAIESLLKALLEAQSGPVTAQVIASQADDMIRQGEALAGISERVIVKIPVIREGLRAIHHLSQKKIPVMATAVFDASQALLAATAGASYAAPYFSRICEADQDGIHILRSIVQLMQRYRYPCKIIAASLHSIEQLRECALIGVDAVTIGDKLFDEWIENHPLTMKTLERFERDWKTAPHSRIL
jgi:transaldolase